MILPTTCAVILLVALPKSSNPPIRIALDRHWATLHPGLQHTRNGDLVLSNQFDALIGLNEAGAPTPLGAKSWATSDGFKTFKFSIDRNRRFSDGTKLSSYDYKRSWEEALRLLPKSANSSVADVMYFIEGYRDFRLKGELSGVRVVDEETLEVRFTQPMRLALDYLSGNRFAAFKTGKHAEEFLGTGHYLIKEIGKNELLLTPNPFNADAADTPPVTLLYYSIDSAREALAHAEIDAIGYSAGDEVYLGGSLPSNVSAVIGQDAMHSVLYLNGMHNRVLSDQSLRQALQWFITDEATKKMPRDAELAGYFEIDPQVFMPLQAGRLPAERVARNIELGKAYFDRLRDRTKAHPIKVWVSESTSWILSLLKEAGIALSPDSGIVDSRHRLDAYYKNFEPDVIALSTSVTNSDPDGIYHVLGKHGAIGSPIIERPTVVKLVEEGRQIADPELIPDHYGRVTDAILTEVPFIHLGFSKTVSLIRSDRLEIKEGTILRNQGHLHIFRRKQ